MYFKADKVRQAATGNWLFILAAFAEDLEPALRKPGRHKPCPVHGGKDGFRLFKDAHETGGGICNTCGPRSDGFELLMWLNRWSFRQTLEAVGGYLGVEPEQGDTHSSPSSTEKPTPTFQKSPQEPAVPAVQNPSSSVSSVVPMFDEQAKPWLADVQEEMKARLERQKRFSAQLKGKIAKIWEECVPITSEQTGPMRLYFKSRGLIFPWNKVKETDSLRFHPSMPYYDEDANLVGNFPAIVTAIRDIDGSLITLHRTYLTSTGKKARVECAKKMMPIPDGIDVNGGSVPLGSPDEGVLGVAEGLETALSAFRATQIPVWSTANAALLETFEPPAGVHTVLIWADRDRSMQGERSAETLKARLHERGINAYVVLPRVPIPRRAKSIDWNDVLLSQGTFGFPRSKYLREFIARENQASAGAPKRITAQ